MVKREDRLMHECLRSHEDTRFPQNTRPHPTSVVLAVVVMVGFVVMVINMVMVVFVVMVINVVMVGFVVMVINVVMVIMAIHVVMLITMVGFFRQGFGSRGRLGYLHRWDSRRHAG